VVIANLPGDRQTLFVVLDGAVVFTEVLIGDAEIAQRIALAVAVANLLGNCETLFEVLNGAVGLTEVLLGEAEIAKCTGFDTPVADLPGERSRFVARRA
jgi:hypothetical protein